MEREERRGVVVFNPKLLKGRAVMSKLRTGLKACLLTLILGAASYGMSVGGVKVPDA